MLEKLRKCKDKPISSLVILALIGAGVLLLFFVTQPLVTEDSQTMRIISFYCLMSAAGLLSGSLQITVLFWDRIKKEANHE